MLSMVKQWKTQETELMQDHEQRKKLFQTEIENKLYVTKNIWQWFSCNSTEERVG